MVAKSLRIEEGWLAAWQTPLKNTTFAILHVDGLVLIHIQNNFCPYSCDVLISLKTKAKPRALIL
jgi:hypothetical protein